MSPILKHHGAGQEELCFRGFRSRVPRSPPAVAGQPRPAPPRSPGATEGLQVEQTRTSARRPSNESLGLSARAPRRELGSPGGGGHSWIGKTRAHRARRAAGVCAQGAGRTPPAFCQRGN